MDPFILLEQAETQGRIPRSIAKRVRDRSKYLRGGILRAEKASGLSFPHYYVEPTLPVARSGAEYGALGVLYARVIPAVPAGNLSILVQFTAALIAFGSKGTVEAVVAHEFTHYVDLVRRFSRMNVLSDERTPTLFESEYADIERTVNPGAIFKDRALVNLIRRKFKGGLVDDVLNRNVQKKWIDAELPVRVTSTGENVVRLDVSSIVSAAFDPLLLARIDALEENAKN